MGNKSSRHKSSSSDSAPSSKRRKKPSAPATTPTGADSKNGKHISCPDLGGAVPYRLYDEEPKVKYNIYRSYRDLDNNKLAKDSSQVDIRIYRRSTAELRPQTLPRGFGRSKSAYVGNGGAGAGEGMGYLDWERAQAVRTPDSEYGGTVRSVGASEYGAGATGTLRSGRSSRLSKRSSIASSCGTNISKLTNVQATDLPSTSDIKRKMAYFEEQYALSLVHKYGQLPTADQLASLAIALRKRLGQTQTITLAAYMEGSVPCDLLGDGEAVEGVVNGGENGGANEVFESSGRNSSSFEAAANSANFCGSASTSSGGGQYVLLVPEALYRGFEAVRRRGHTKPRLWAVLARDAVRCVGIESGAELARMYEQQIALMFDDASIRVLAQHAAECVVDYVRHNTYLDRNAALHGVVSNTPPNPDGLPKYLAVVIGDKEFKWGLYEIFKKPGLRKEISLQTDDLIQDPDEESLEPDPWTYHHGPGAEPLKYGYRGQLIEWNFMRQTYELDREEDEKFCEEAMWRPEDFHRLYMPYRRLFGRKAMATYCSLGKKDKLKLADRLKTEFDGNEERDEIQPVYRPLGDSDAAAPNFASVNLEHMDLLRARLDLGSGDLRGTSLRGSRLLLAVVPRGVEWASLQGADVSYSTLDSSLTPDRAAQMIARHIATRRSSSPRSSRSSRASFSPPTTPHGPNSPLSPISPASPLSPTSPKVNGVQETNLDQHLGTVIENDVEYPSTKVAVMVTNSQGQMVPISQIIQEKLREEEELERSQVADEVDQSSAGGQSSGVSVVRSVSGVTSAAPGNAVVTQEKVRVSSAPTVAAVGPSEKKRNKKRRNQQQKQQRQQQQQRPQSEVVVHHNPVLNISATSEQSATDFNFLDASDDTRPRAVPRRHPMQRSTTFDHSTSTARYPPAADEPDGVAPMRLIETRAVSATSIPVTHHQYQQTVPVLHHPQPISNSNHPNQPRPLTNLSGHGNSAGNGSGNQSYSEPNPRSPSQGRSFSSSHIPRETSSYSSYSHHTSSSIPPHTLHDPLPPVRGAHTTATLPPMVKSASQHGDLRGSSLGFPPLSRRSHRSSTASTASVCYIRRSQVFNIMKGLTIMSLEDNMPDAGVMFVGRDQEVRDVTDLLSSAGRIITIFGCSGMGKSALAISAAVEMKQSFVVPVHFDCRGCMSTESVWKVMMTTLELRFKLSEMAFFCNWINCREQKPLFVFDNVEGLPFAEDRRLSEMLDGLIGGVKNIRVLSTCDRNFFRGTSAHESYRVGALRYHADGTGDSVPPVLGAMVPDLHEGGIQELAAACDHVTLGLLIIGKSFAIEDVDAGKLYEDLTTTDPGDFPLGKLEDVLADVTSDDIDKQKLGKVARCVYTVLDYFHPEVRELLCKLSPACSFNIEMACKLTGWNTEKVREMLSELVDGYLLRAVTKHGGRFFIPRVVKIALDTCWPDNGSNSRAFVIHIVGLLKELCVRYHSKECRDALDIVDAEFDNILDTVNRILEREDALEVCAEFASPEFALFLYQILPRGMYEDLYDSLVQQAEEDEEAQWQVQMYSLTSLAHMHCSEHELDRARICGERAYVVAQKRAGSGGGGGSIGGRSTNGSGNNKDMAHCMLTLGKVYWQDKDTKDKGEALVKKALDTLKQCYGLRHLRTLYANEEYGFILTEKGSFQTARHFYNLSDFIVKELLDTHPLLLDGYNCRRAIWDHLCLFARATEVSEHAAATATLHLGEEHPTTAAVLSAWSEAVRRRGSLSDAVHIAVRALACRIKSLGDCHATARSYQAVSELLLRSGQYDEALRFASSALEVYERLGEEEESGAGGRKKLELQGIVAQCRFRLECRATRFVELESRDAANKKVMSKDSASVSSALSTEV